ncbi:PAS domain S-box protein [Roseofilum sp. Guam]|uniref:PAS domain S-box protein n=1 Tax=Roseofilum sp. Guam TaxID=2821502 RepID=UPI001B1C322D|nr:PAS domain S-box protein [Roseofilum sp. Guam]MBP0030187.1 PAS domain S-box protein [Roseofilum sp. Guam]
MLDKEMQIRSIFQAMQDVVLVLDADLQEIEVIPTHPMIFAHPQWDIVNQTLELFWDGDQTEIFRSQIERSLARQYPVTFEYSVRQGNRDLWFTSHISPISKTSVVWVAREITDRKKAELRLQNIREQLEMIVEQRTGALQRLNAELEQRVQERTAQLQEVNEQLRQEIGDRHHAQEELRRSKQLLQLVMDNIPQFIVWKDLHSMYLGCNRNFAQLAGLSTPEEIVGKTDYDLFWTRDEADWYRQGDRRVMNRNHPEYHRIESKLKEDGTRLWIDTNTIPLHDAKDQVVGILRTYENVTERKQIEEQLRLTQFTLNRLGDIVVLMSTEAQLFYVNDSACRTLGYEQSELLNLKFYQIDTFYSAESWQDRWHELRQLKSLTCESILWTSSGVPIPVEVRMNYLKFNGKEYNCGIFRDISERKKAEEALRESEERFRAIFEQVAVGMAIVTLNGHFFRVNQKFCDILGYNRPEMLSRTFEDITAPEDLGKLMGTIDRILTEDNPSETLESQYICKDNKIVWGHVTISLVRKTSGENHYYIWVFEEISDRKQAEEKLKASLREKEVLLKEIHHRVKNNLMVVSNLLELQSEYLENSSLIKILSDSQNRIYSMLLIHEKLYRTTNLDRVQLDDYLESLVAGLLDSYQGREQKVELILNLNPIHLNVETANPCGLIVNELVSNALKHAFPNKPQNYQGIIWVGLEKNEDRVITIEVKDNGIGLPANFDIRQVDTMGLELVCTLADQLKTKPEIIPGIGTHIRLKFWELKYPRRW